MQSPIAFVRAFPMRNKTLCSEPVVAWAQARGKCVGLTRREQFRLWKAHGGEDGANLIAVAFSLSEIDPSATQTGDAVLVECIDGAQLLGLRNIGQFCIVAGFGKIHVGRYPIKKAWSLA